MRVGFMLVVGAVACGWVAAAAPSRAQQCDDFNECTGAGVCGADDICEDGPPVGDGTACNAPLAGSCLQNPTCLEGSCSGGSAMPNGTPCRVFNSPCFTQGSCLGPPVPIPGFPVLCFGSLPITCPDDGNPLTAEFCNPESGQCQSINTCVSDTCVQRQVQGTTCVETPRNNGGACDDFNECTANTRCQDGFCVESSGTQPTATPVPTPTPTPQQQPPCTGDCGNDRTVTVDELITMVNIANGAQLLAVCPSADGNVDGSVAIDDIIAAVGNALNGCA